MTLHMEKMYGAKALQYGVPGASSELHNYLDNIYFVIPTEIMGKQVR